MIFSPLHACFVKQSISSKYYVPKYALTTKLKIFLHFITFVKRNLSVLFINMLNSRE